MIHTKVMATKVALLSMMTQFQTMEAPITISLGYKTSTKTGETTKR